MIEEVKLIVTGLNNKQKEAIAIWYIQGNYTLSQISDGLNIHKKIISQIIEEIISRNPRLMKDPIENIKFIESLKD